MDRLPDHDRMVEEELFARLAAEMGPIAVGPDDGSRLRTALSAVLVVVGLAAVVLGLSSSLILSASGYSAALFGLVTLAPVLEQLARRLRAGVLALHRSRR